MKDWEVKHQEFCKETPEEWKVKTGAKDREETGLEEFEDQFQNPRKKGFWPFSLAGWFYMDRNNEQWI